MPDELTNDSEVVVEDKPETPIRSDNRFKDLSEKVKTTAEERDTLAAQKAALEKENSFYKGFSKVTSKYPEAGEHQDKILEKYQAGYDMEDAAIAVLAKAGKLNAPQAQRQSPAGGSATTAVGAEEKSVSDMTPAEKRQRLMEMENAEPGSLARTLRQIKMNSDY